MCVTNPFPDFCIFHIEQISDDNQEIHPKEIALSQSYKSETRKKEFISGRRCAHRAMKKAGYDKRPILKNDDRSPNWPKGIVGSISHTKSYAAAIINQRGKKIQGVGIDIENIERKIDTKISRHVLLPEEKEKWIDQQSDQSQINNLRQLFSIKESIFKCFYPKEKIYLGFHDASVTDMDDKGFNATLLKDPLNGKSISQTINGKIQRGNDIILCSILWV